MKDDQSKIVSTPDCEKAEKRSFEWEEISTWASWVKFPLRPYCGACSSKVCTNLDAREISLITSVRTVSEDLSESILVYVLFVERQMPGIRDRYKCRRFRVGRNYAEQRWVNLGSGPALVCEFVERDSEMYDNRL